MYLYIFITLSRLFCLLTMTLYPLSLKTITLVLRTENSSTRGSLIKVSASLESRECNSRLNIKLMHTISAFFLTELLGQFTRV